jgi:hypothetical protein
MTGKSIFGAHPAPRDAIHFLDRLNGLWFLPSRIEGGLSARLDSIPQQNTITRCT